MKIRAVIYGVSALLIIFSQVYPQNHPKRIISLAPGITEMICKIEAADMLVGRTQFCQYPHSVKQLPQVV